jgi:LacI family transcriptional regulator
MKNVTIKDVAKKANVSITTVSLVLNNKSDEAYISKETIELVRRVADELHYSKNYMASSLRSKVTHTIGLIIPEIDNGYYSRIVEKLDYILSNKGYTLFTAISNNDFEREISLFAQMEARQVDYLLFLPSSSALKEENSDRLHETLEKIKIKFVVLDRKTKLNHHVEVVNDDFVGASFAVEHLINNGYKRIACLTGPKGVSSSDDRLEGYIKTLQKHNILVDNSLIYEGDYSYKRALKISEKILKRDDVDAIFAFNDSSAYAVYANCHKLNMKVGQDLALVGFDDNAFSELISPPLTSIRQDIDNICLTAVNKMFEETNKREVIKITPKLIERKSVGRK